MNPIDQANFEAIDNAYKTALTELAEEGINQINIPDDEETALFLEVKERIENDRDPAGVIDFIKTRFRAHHTRRQINFNVADVFDDGETDFDYALAA